MTTSSFEIFLAPFRYYTLIQTDSADKMQKKGEKMFYNEFGEI